MKLGDCMAMFLNSKGEVYVIGDNVEGQLASDV